MKFWYRKKSIYAVCLLPLSWLFNLIVCLRKKLYQKQFFKSYKAHIPVIVVGNIVVGGTGKTPLVIYLVEQLQKQGLKVAVISRGFGAKISSPKLVNSTSNPLEVGDEPVLIAKHTNCPVVVSPHRNLSIELLKSEFSDLDLIIADDGLQHYKLQRNCEIVVIDGLRFFGNELLLPAGPLREPINRLNKANAIIINQSNCDELQYSINTHCPIFTMQTKAIHFVNVKTGLILDLEQFNSNKIVAMAGIGNPDKFFILLENLGCKIDAKHIFKDHQFISTTKLEKLTKDNQQLVMTEKDAVKYQNTAKENWWFIKISASFNEKDADQILKIVTNNIYKN